MRNSSFCDFWCEPLLSDDMRERAWKELAKVTGMRKVTEAVVGGLTLRGESVIFDVNAFA
jgi:hypothetical protein